jgi:hypothetical protein
MSSHLKDAGRLEQPLQSVALTSQLGEGDIDAGDLDRQLPRQRRIGDQVDMWLVNSAGQLDLGTCEGRYALGVLAYRWAVGERK